MVDGEERIEQQTELKKEEEKEKWTDNKQGMDL